MPTGSLCIVPVIESLTGPASFQLRLKAGLEQLGWEVQHDPARPDTQAILVIAATRHIGPLLQARRRGVRVVQRLNGINWIHRKRNTGLGHYLRAEVRNRLLLFTRQSLAERVVYQSRFAQDWWHRVYGAAPGAEQVILNGVDLQAYSPQGAEQPPRDHIRVQVVEGHLAGGYEIGLDFALHYAAALERAAGQRVQVVVAGQVDEAVRARAAQVFPSAWVEYSGALKRSEIPALHRTAHLFFSAELNASCPNAVIEALACGCPVTGFAAGALPELVPDSAGRLAPYGGDPWNLDLPDFSALADQSLDLLAEQGRYRAGARQWAEARLGQAAMTAAYEQALIG